MRLLEFDTAILPRNGRLPAFRTAAADFVVDAVDGEPFHAVWSLLALGDVNLIRSEVSPVRYRRDLTMIEVDGQDRVAVHCYLEGGSEGLLDGRPVEVAVGGAMVWDLSRTIDCRSTGPSKLLIATMPRFMLDEVFAEANYSRALPPSLELALAVGHLDLLVSMAADIPEAAAAGLGNSVRDLLAAAMVPAMADLPTRSGGDGTSLLIRICRRLDQDPSAESDAAALAAVLRVTEGEVGLAVAPAGGLHRLVERRRLLAAYRRLCDADDPSSISSIAYRCGYVEATRFTHAFTTMFGCAPREVRRRARGHLPRWAGAYRVEAEYGSFLKQ